LNYKQQPPPFYGHYTGQPALAPVKNGKDFDGAKFYCPDALADSNQHIQIREKILEFSSKKSTLSLYTKLQNTLL